MCRTRSHYPVTSKTIYLVRHGQTAWTEAQRVQGRAPVPLTETGKTQARLVAEYISDDCSSELSRIETSDLVRARSSAAVIQEALDTTPEVRENEALRERDFGIYQGLDDPLYHHRKQRDRGQANPILWTPEDGESWRDVETRVLTAWESIRSEMNGGEARIVVSHIGPLFCLLAAVDGRRLETEMNDGGVDIASISKVTIEDGESRLVDRNLTVESR